MSSTPRLPPADPWDRRTGHNPVTSFKVQCTWEPLNGEWARVSAHIMLHDDIYRLGPSMEVFRVVKVSITNPGESFESPVSSALAFTKKMLGSGGVPVSSVSEASVGHTSLQDGSTLFRWVATVDSRLTVAVHRLDGNLQGQARLILVE